MNPPPILALALLSPSLLLAGLALVWAYNVTHVDMPAGRHVRRTPEPRRFMLVGGERPGVYDQDEEPFDDASPWNPGGDAA